MPRNALQSIAQEAAEVFYPIRHLTSRELITEFFRDLGYELPGSDLFTELPQLVEKVEGLVDAVEQIGDAESDSDKWSGVIELLVAIAGVAVEIKDSVDAVKSDASSIAGFIANSDIDDLARRLVDYLLAKYLWRNHRNVYGVLLFVGVIDEIDMPEDAAKFQPEFTLRKIWWERITSYFSEPQELPEIVYGWETDFDTEAFLRKLHVLLSGFRLPGGLYEQSENVRTALGNSTPDLTELRMPLFQNAAFPDARSQFGIDVTPVEQQGSVRPGFAILPYVFGEAEFDFDLNEKLEILFEIAGSIDAGIGVVFRPGSVTTITNLFTAPGEAIDFGADMTLRQREGTGETVLVGDPEGTRLAIEGPGAKVFVRRYDELDVGFEVALDAIRLVVSGGDGDGFLARILGDEGITAEAGLGIGWSRQGGVTFTGSGALQIQLATHIELGPLEITSLTIGLRFEGGAFVLEAGAGLKLELGPLVAVVENMGLDATLSFPEDGGNLGRADIDFGFKPPNGVGLSIDAAVIKGGGYLYFDFDREEYAGALELTFVETISLKAIGLITTRMPDGSKGFSLLIIITAEFTIQLSFGFVFLGAGGLIGLHRTMNLEPLAEGVRTGATANIMFPTNIVENAPQIISDLRAFFPVEEGHFLIGPMVKLGWGQPSLLSISLGIVIEIRTTGSFGIERIAILGVLKCILPDEDAAILVLQVNFIGAIDFEEKTAFFFASIFESRLLFMTIEGEMGVLVSWGDNPNFLVSVGGFHPRFEPPPLPFPVPQRLAINILNESWARIRVEAYFAVTSNSVQFGVKAELFFGFSALSLEGYIAFDALFQFDPFFFIVSVSGGVTLKVFGAGLFSIDLSLSLEGPTPWRAQGYGKIKILFFTIKARFDKTWGENRDTTLEPVEVLPLITAELDKLTNWEAILPSSSNLGVSLRDVPAPSEENEALVLHPVGTLRVSQRTVPLDFDLDKVGNSRPSDGTRFTVSASGAFSKKEDRSESFARAQFQDLSDSEKLSSPAFESEHGGLELSAEGDQLQSGRMTVRHVRYEVVTIDSAYKRLKLRFLVWFKLLFTHFMFGNAASKASVSHKRARQLKPRDEAITLRSTVFVVATNHDNVPLSEETAFFASKAQADSYLASRIATDPSLVDALHVIPDYEANVAS